MALKHQVGAHAAHKALQDIASLCYLAPTKIKNNAKHDTSECTHATSINCNESPPYNENSSEGMYPLKWIETVLREISMTETVRDSTLRRSTGFALGILALY